MCPAWAKTCDAEGYLDKAEAKPRLRHFKERLQSLEEQALQLRAQAQSQVDLQLVISRLKELLHKIVYQLVSITGKFTAS